jgi:hypothetical protein
MSLWQFLRDSLCLRTPVKISVWGFQKIRIESQAEQNALFQVYLQTSTTQTILLSVTIEPTAPRILTVFGILSRSGNNTAIILQSLHNTHIKSQSCGLAQARVRTFANRSHAKVPRWKCSPRPASSNSFQKMCTWHTLLIFKLCTSAWSGSCEKMSCFALFPQHCGTLLGLMEVERFAKSLI